MLKKIANCRVKSSVVVLSLAFLLVFTASVGGTLAWLSVKTDEVVNTFTSSALFADASKEFTLWEHMAKDSGDGVYELSTDTKADDGKNDYCILPGVDIPKDPTVTIDNLLEDAYLYIKVNSTLPDTMDYKLDSCWSSLDGFSGIYVYTGESGNLIRAFTNSTEVMNINIIKEQTIKVRDDYSPANEEYMLAFEAYMVQAAYNGDNAKEAWQNTFGKQ